MSSAARLYKKASFKCQKKKLKAYKELFIMKGTPKTCSFEPEK